MQIEVDKKSGFCFGVTNAISKVEEILKTNDSLLCLGDIVHNSKEVERLNNLGMTTILNSDIATTTNKTVLIRSHGEPPATYHKLKHQNNTVIDATCPVVLKLQQRIKKSYAEIILQNRQLVIYGKHNHPEVIGLNGQTNNNAIVVNSPEDLVKIDFSRPIELYCQTTMPIEGFQVISNLIEEKASKQVIIHDTICRQVANRVPHLKEFSKQFELIVFVSGKKSSNGKFLHSICKASNANTYFVSSVDELQNEWFNNVKSVGICGATSTPQWLMEKVKQEIESYSF